MANEKAVILVNIVGSTLFFIYFVVFWMFTINTRTLYRQFFAAILILGLTLSYTEWYQMNRDDAIKVMGKAIITIIIINDWQLIN